MTYELAIKLLDQIIEHPTFEHTAHPEVYWPCKAVREFLREQCPPQIVPVTGPPKASRYTARCLMER